MREKERRRRTRRFVIVVVVIDMRPSGTRAGRFLDRFVLQYLTYLCGRRRGSGIDSGGTFSLELRVSSS
jgi:hypothetical protein